MGRFRDGFTSTGATAGLIALMLLTTGAAVAAPAKIGSKQIKNHSITSADLAKNAVNGLVIKNGTVTGADVQDGSLTRADIKTKTLTGKEVKDGTLTGADINSSTLGTVPNATNATNASTVNGVSTRIYEKSVSGCVGPRDPQIIFTGATGWTIYLLCVPGNKDAPYRWQLYFQLGNSGVFVDNTVRRYDITEGESQLHQVSARAATTGEIGDSSYYQTTSSGTFVTSGGHLTKLDVSTQSPGATASTSAPNYSSMRYQMVVTERE